MFYALASAYSRAASEHDRLVRFNTKAARDEWVADDPDEYNQHRSELTRKEALSIFPAKVFPRYNDNAYWDYTPFGYDGGIDTCYCKPKKSWYE